MEKKPVKIVETVLRDGHQSLAATRMRISDMLPALEQLDNAGYYALEAWGGATFDSCLRFLNEDPWQRLRTLKKHLRKTPIQMLLRGQNILLITAYPSSVFSMLLTIHATWNVQCVPLRKQAHMFRAVLYIPSAPTIRTKTLFN